jgi:hypothetical protein
MEVSGQLHSPAAYTRERAPAIHWIEGWVRPRAGLDAVVRRKIPSPYRDSNPPIIQPAAQRYTTELSGLLLVYRRELKWEGVDWIHVAHDRDHGTDTWDSLKGR